MRRECQAFGPDELKVLSQIITSASLELQKMGSDDCDQLRERIARQALKYASDDLLNINEIRQKVVASLRDSHKA